MIRMTVTKYKERTGEVISIDSATLNTKDAKWWMNRNGIYNDTLGPGKKRCSIKRKRGNVITEVEFKWLNSLETL